MGRMGIVLNIDSNCADHEDSTETEIPRMSAFVRQIPSRLGLTRKVWMQGRRGTQR